MCIRDRKYATEFLGTAILIILGNGAVANVELKGTKGHQSGWIDIAVGYGCLLYTSPSPRDRTRSRMPSSA
ncbi:hypothetical protein PVA38_11435 [Streptococcus pneumoniae D39]|nr:hypothetical protein PVA38_11435 [Streptococcus pneumoniae D39]